MRFWRAAILGLVGIALTGCVLPGAGPTVGDIEDEADSADSFFLVDVGPQTGNYLTMIGERRAASAIDRFAYTPTIALRPGDQITVSIFEGSSGTAGSSGPQMAQSILSSPSTNLPTEIVESNGQVIIPYVGRVVAAGKTPVELSEEIAKKLSTQVVQPQVVIGVNEATKVASVNGDVNRPGLVPLTLRGETLLDAIAIGGGPKFASNESEVRLIRGMKSITLSLDDIIDYPAENKVVQPNDQIVVLHRPKTFVLLGAAEKPAQYNFDTPQVTLAEAVARSGGPQDAVGHLAGVFLLRSVPKNIARRILAAPLAHMPNSDAAAKALASADDSVQIIYHVDMATANGLFWARKIQIRDKDVVLLANASGTQLGKLLTLLRGVTGMVYDLTTYTVPKPG